jgi:hypothetical protein
MLQSAFMAGFQCKGAECEDTCCRGWEMQLDEPMRKKYESDAPLLLAAVDTGVSGAIMRRDAKTDSCVKFDHGLCGIHKQYGTAFLGDACHFYPRVTRRLGEAVLMTGTPSCPEVVRLALAQEAGQGLQAAQGDRLPQTLKDYLPSDIPSAQAVEIHQAFLAAAQDEAASPARIMARLVSVAQSLERVDRKTWPQAVPFYLRMADGRLPTPEPQPADPFNLLHALWGLIVAARKPMPARLHETVQTMATALECRLEWEDVTIVTSETSLAAYESLAVAWKQHHEAHYALVLKRWIALQCAMAMFPFAGFGATLSQRMNIIAIRFATVRLALMCSCGIEKSDLPQDVVIRVIQSLSRFMDHLADASFSLRIYQDAGWTQEARLRGLLAD